MTNQGRRVIFDLDTLLVVGAALALTLSAGLILGIPLGALGASREGRAMRIWLGALVVQALFWVLFLSSREIHPLFGIVTVNTLSYLAMVEYFRAIREFLGCPQFRTVMYLSVLGVLLINVWFGIVSPDYTIRVASISLPGTVLMVWLAIALFRHAETGIARPARVTAIFFLITAGALLLRWADALADPNLSIADSSVQQIALMIYGFFPIFCSVGFLLMQTTRAITRLEALASVDDLTGALNRRAFREIAQHALAGCQRGRRPAALLLLDLDYFKQINDSHGHEAGDQMLVQFHRLLQECVRDEDVVCRLGGEEFAVLTPGADGAAALLPARRILKATEQMRVKYGTQSMQITVSIGLTEWDGQSTAIEPLLREADKQLYRAKDAGRNRIAAGHLDHCAQSPMHGAAVSNA